jgi:hypothetical protein
MEHLGGSYNYGELRFVRAAMRQRQRESGESAISPQET